jgi:hypothetical protein
VVTADGYRRLGETAWRWVRSQLREDDGPWLPESVPDGSEPTPSADRDSLYAGIAGLAPVLAEIAQRRALNELEQDLADRIVARLAAAAAGRSEPSLYGGLAGDATGLRLLAPGREAVALDRLVALMTPAGWLSTLDTGPRPGVPATDIIAGTAGIVLTAVWAGGVHADAIATTGGEALLADAERTEAGLDWGSVPGASSRCPNYSHGTAGVATALAVAGTVLGRSDFVDAAVLGAKHLVEIGFLDDGGFIVPHTIPPARQEVEPVTYTWCHGPAGTSHLFAALSYAGVTEVAGYGVTELRARCLHSILTSGVPQRLRPGFWDNDGRCCGTAGVGDVLLDAAQDSADSARAGMLLAAARTHG